MRVRLREEIKEILASEGLKMNWNGDWLRGNKKVFLKSMFFNGAKKAIFTKDGFVNVRSRFYKQEWVEFECRAKGCDNFNKKPDQLCQECKDLQWENDGDFCP